MVVVVVVVVMVVVLVTVVVVVVAAVSSCCSVPLGTGRRRVRKTRDQAKVNERCACSGRRLN